MCQVGWEDPRLFCEPGTGEPFVPWPLPCCQAWTPEAWLFLLLAASWPQRTTLVVRGHQGDRLSVRTLAAEWESPPHPLLPKGGSLLLKAVPLRWGGKGTCSLFRLRLRVPQGWPQRAISGSTVVLGLLVLKDAVRAPVSRFSQNISLQMTNVETKSSVPA